MDDEPVPAPDMRALVPGAPALEPDIRAPAPDACARRGLRYGRERRALRAGRTALAVLALVACEPAPPAAPSSTTPRPAAPSSTMPRPAGPPLTTPRPTAPAEHAAPEPRDAGVIAPDGAPLAGTPGQVRVTVSDECGLLLDQIYFGPGSADLRDGQRPILDETADMFRCFLRTGEITKWQVVGNTDDTERDPAVLSLARAQAVADALIARGVDPASLDVTGAGATQPQDRRRTPAARAKNRRVHFLVQKRGGASP